MNESRRTSIYVVISIIRDLVNGKRIKVGDNIIAMDDEGHIGYLLRNSKGETIAGDISIKDFVELVEEYEIIPIPALM
ncbi:hypothetical protein KAW18_02990 [candidate division WOR-3 bacterium]|nr:hypothetical protein [candidate division WOR-3 bacterium]